MDLRSNLKLASFDGGGIRGLSQLGIMSNIMHRLNWDRHLNGDEPLLPCEHFDLIGGSGTGGIIAIMLAKLRMTVEDASEEFCTLLDVFKGLDATPQERTQMLKERMEDIMKRRELPANTRLLEGAQPQSCQCFVVASLRANASTRICLRSYPVPTHPTSNITIIEAMLATCAMQPSFSPVKLGPKYKETEYIGASLGANNPIHDVINEAHSLFGKESTVASILSVGSGHPGIITIPSNGGEDKMYKVMREIMNDCMEKAREIKQKIGRAGIYFRFSVEQGMQNDHPTQVTDPGWIAAQTESYLEEQVDQLDAFTKGFKDAIYTVRLDHLKPGNVEVVSTEGIPMIGTDAASKMYEDTILAKLKPLNLEYGSPIDECLPGTRQDILSTIIAWAVDINAPNIFWLEGYPGIGKSAIAATLVEKFRKSNRLGSSFFFRRELANVMTVNALWRTVAHDLGRRYPSIRKPLIAKISANESIVTTVNVDSLFSELIQEPLIACNPTSAEGSPIIVIDALDECGGLDGQHSIQRINLIRTLKTWSTLSKTFKLVVTSRRESDISCLFASTNHRSLEIPTENLGNMAPSNDIERFLEYHFGRITAQYPNELPADWPGHPLIKELARMANGLFIWVVTILKILSQGEPQEQLSRILAGAGAGGLTTLYSWILKASFPVPSEKVIKSFHSIVGTIILAKDPLPISSIGELCSIDQPTVKYILNGLQSVLYQRIVPRFKHQSFVDFLIDQTGCPPAFLIDLKHQTHNLAIKSLQVMKTNLRFNICELKSSYHRNSEIPDLDIRIRYHITPHIRYSAAFWASHLADTSFDPELLELVQDFMENRFLFWLEVLSLTKRVNTGSSAIQSLIDQLRANNQDDHMARDMKKFLAAFGGVILQSVPHIYVSALPFLPRSSAIRKHYIGHYPRTIDILSGGEDNWPAIQNILLGHTSTVQSVAFSPDGRRIVSGSDDMTIRVWDAETGEVVAGPFQGHIERVNSVSFSPDGRRIVSGSDDMTIRVWDAETGEVVAGPFQGHIGRVNSVSFSPGGRRIVSGSDDMTIRVWDAETGEVVAGPFQGHMGRVNSVSFSPDGRRIVSGSDDWMIRVWDAETGEVVAGPFEGHTALVRSVAFSPDGQRIVSSSFDRTVRIWGVETGEKVASPFEGHTNLVDSVAFSPNGRRIVSGSADQTVRIWDAEMGEAVARPFEGHTAWISSVAFSPDGRRIVSGSDNKTVRVWNAEMGGITPFLELKFGPFQLSLGPWLAKRVRKKVAVNSFEGHTHSVRSVAFSRDGRRIASGSWDKTIRVWDAETGEVVAGPLQGHTDSVHSVVFSPDGQCIVSVSSGRTVQVQVWNPETGRVVVSQFENLSELLEPVVLSPNGPWFVSGSHNRMIRVWNAETGEVVAGPFQLYINCHISLALSPDGRHVASGSTDETIRVWNAETGEAVALPFEGHNDWVTSVAFSPNGRRIASGSRDTTIRVWDTETGKVIADPFEGHTDGLTSVAFSGDGRRIVSASYDKTIRVWDAETGEVVAGPFQGHTDSVNSVVFSPDGRLIASGSDDMMIRVWNLKDTNPDLPLFANTSYMEDGWILGPNSELLFWVPPTLRTGLWRPGNTTVIGKMATRLGFKNFAHGESWTRCK
ncbi:hypothetical protein M408DRAFT_332227, partial [Serendipita vermifera MAFF 305830]